MPKKILIVDDSSSMRQMVNFTLTCSGYHVVEAQDGPDALNKSTAHKIDLFITDLNMPNMNGFDLIRALKTQPNYRFTPIILLTTESQQEKKAEGKAIGATGWIVKPFQVDQLVAVVKKVCP